MTQFSREVDILLGTAGLGRLMPMHLALDAAGTILHAGPTLRKVCHPTPLIGASFFERFEVRRPAGLASVEAIRATRARALRVLFDGPTPIPLTAVAAPGREGSVFLNLSFGIAVIDRLRDLDLNSTDFAATDSTVELLYLREAQTAAIDEWRKLSERLTGARDAAERRAFADPLTLLVNRRGIHATAERLIAEAQPFVLMIIDLDHFKEVNDTYGHPTGDAALCRVADILREETRNSDIVGRIGGDEFVVLMSGLDDATLAQEIATRIIMRMEKPMVLKTATVNLSASIGISTSLHYAQPGIERMFADADRALYASKSAGRAQFTMVDPADVTDGDGA
ncbi:MAG: GGDEF domain-containing protein [Pseudomonadota bacterium]